METIDKLNLRSTVGRIIEIVLSLQTIIVGEVQFRLCGNKAEPPPSFHSTAITRLLKTTFTVLLSNCRGQFF